MARHLLAIKGRTRVDNYLMNTTTGAVARKTRQAGFNRRFGEALFGSASRRRRRASRQPRSAPPTRR
ncbi:MAG: hypothetical protein Ct9H300mP1_28780 [Planctomycetaceae bacterium]|nr:MAG: hypothetical protein Ct9H300mP1_28780 [Planctomycetaceae bacterium]